MQVAAGTYEQGHLLDAGWPAAGALVAWAGWRPPGRTSQSRLNGWVSLLVPATFTLTSVAVLVYARALGTERMTGMAAGR